jgi:polysaccharide chain length determinant protein (PEP-CTERM system associated)
MAQSTPRDTLVKYADLLRRRRWSVIIPFAVIGSLTVPIVLWLPATYKSTTVITVEAQKVPESFVRTTVTTPIEDRLHAISEQILSRTRLERIVEKFHLYEEPAARPSGPAAWLRGLLGQDSLTTPGEASMAMLGAVDRMRRNITIEVPRPRGRERVSTSSISISFSGEDPATVRDVTNELASLFIEENLRVREAQAEGTTEFLDSELQQLKAQLEVQEHQLRTFKERSMGELPEQLETNLRTLDRLQLERQGLQQSLKNAEDRSADLKRQLAAFADATGEGSTPPDLERRLQILRARLADLRTEYRDEYPDIIILKKEIAAAEEELARLSSQPAQQPAGSEHLSAANPLAAQLADQQREINSIKQRQQTLVEQIREYERRVESTPQREQQLTMLMRDYENVQRSYQAMLDKRQEAKIAESLERRQKGEIFRVIDPALLPQRPDKPNRPLFMLVGILGGLAAGLGLAFFREQLDPSIQTEDDLIAATTGLPLLAVIPDIQPPGKKPSRPGTLPMTRVGSGR